MNPVSPVAPRPLLPAPEPTTPPDATQSLLPAAAAPSIPQLQDAMTMLYRVIAQLNEQQTTRGKADVETAKAQRDVAAQKEREALERAKKAAEEGGFFDWLSKDVGLAGAVGLVTFDYPLVAADIAAHKLGVFDLIKEKVDLVDVGAVATGRYDVVAADVLLRKTDLAPDELRALLDKSGVPKDAPGVSKKDVEPIAKDAMLANLLIASTAATVLSAGTTGALVVALLGVAISMGGSEIAKRKSLDGVLGDGSSQWIGVGMQVYGTAAASMSGFAGGAAIMPANATRGAALAEGLASAMRGTDQIVTTVHDRERDTANIDAASSRRQVTRLERLIEQITDAIKEVNDSHQKAAEALRGAIETANQTDVALTQAIKG